MKDTKKRNTRSALQREPGEMNGQASSRPKKQTTTPATSAQAAIDALLKHYESHFGRRFHERSMYAIQLAEGAGDDALLAYLLRRHQEYWVMVDQGRRR